MFTGFDTTSCQGRGGHTGTPHGFIGGALGTGPPWEGIIQPLVTTRRTAHEVCAGSQPQSTLHLAGCQKTNEQILPLPGCPLPSPTPATRSRFVSAWDKLEPPWQQQGWERGKADLAKKEHVKEDWSTAGSTSCTWGRTLALSSSFSQTALGEDEYFIGAQAPWEAGHRQPAYGE